MCSSTHSLMSALGGVEKLYLFPEMYVTSIFHNKISAVLDFGSVICEILRTGEEALSLTF
jgi:hypothetical protein